MLCCIRRAKNVEKNEETEQEIKQDQGKAEDNVHKAATKIQASFRGHITRQKMKSEKEEKNQSDPLKPADEDEQKKPVSPAEETPQEVSTEAETKSEPVAEQPDLPSAHPSLSAPAEEDEEVLQEEDPADVPDDTEKKPETQHVESEVSAGEQLSENLDGEKQSV